MAEKEVVITNVDPGIMSGFCVGVIDWRLGNSNITKIEAKLSGGTGTFNAKVSNKHTHELGWVVDSIPDGTLEDLDTLYWHLRADDLANGTGASDTDPVTVWESYPSNLSNFRQSTSGSQPQIRTALGPGDDTDTVHFDGTDDRMDSYQVGDGAYTIPAGTDWTMFVVIGDLPTLTPCPLVATYDTSDTFQGSLYGRDSRMKIRDDDENQKQTTSSLPAPDQIRMVQFDISAEKATERVDGDSSYAPASGPKDEGFTFDAIGASAYDSDSDFLNGGISEILLFSHFLTTNQIEAVEGYLAHRWGISLVSGHTYESTNPFLGASGASSDYINTLQHITLDTTYTTCSAVTTAIDDGQRLSFYMPNAQSAGTGDLTVKITYTVD